ncbi:MAG TPA: hypothetical protein VGO61_07020 [Steroidobacteraceae bacterium]|jgi:hypothetical protein|nr:hypothetical protein [Steroidobacteraceae bacterium]
MSKRKPPRTNAVPEAPLPAGYGIARPCDWMQVLEARLKELRLSPNDAALARKLASAIWAIEAPELGGAPSKKVADTVAAWHRAWEHRAFVTKPRVASFVELLESKGYSRSRKKSRTSKSGDTALSKAAKHFRLSESTVHSMSKKRNK